MRLHLASAFSALSLSVVMLASCGGQSTQLPADSPSAVTAGLVTDAPILPGSKGDRNHILPGSKGDRSHIASLEVQLRLPEIGFETAFTTLAEQKPAQWTARIDALPVKTRLIKTRIEGGDAIIYFALEELDVERLSTHELLFVSPEQIVQAAALVPEFQPGQVSISEPVTTQSTAVWLIAEQYQQQKGAKVQDLSPEDIKTLTSLPELPDLAQQIRDVYRSSKGKSDFKKAEQILKKLEQVVRKADEKLKLNSKSSSATPQNSSLPAPSLSPAVSPTTVPSPTPVASSTAENPTSDGKPVDKDSKDKKAKKENDNRWRWPWFFDQGDNKDH